MGKIAEFMLKQHGEILVLLNNFDKSRNLDDFQKLREKQENHMYAEEQAIFVFYAKRKNFPVLMKILQQHELLEKYLQAIQKDLKRSIEDYKSLMKEHVALEDTKFYPLLDHDLTPAEQGDMLIRAKEYIYPK